MPHSFTDCLHAGLVAECRKSGNTSAESRAFMLGWLEAGVAAQFTGTESQKRAARRELQEYIYHGRCILNARDAAAKAAEIEANNNASQIKEVIP